MMEQIRETGALVMVAAALVVVSYLAFTGSEAAQGALISILAAGTGYFMRGRVQRAR
jgi:hypothetical protein